MENKKQHKRKKIQNDGGDREIEDKEIEKEIEFRTMGD
jgi:hypothetical protein